MRWALAASLVAAIVATCIGAATPGRSAAEPDPRVAVIGDSVFTAVMWNPAPRAIVQQGLDLEWEVAVCRRLTGESCPFEGGEAPNLVQLVSQLGTTLAPTVVVEMGYNDPQESFEQGLEEAVDSLLHAGVRHILWLTLRESRQSFVDMNKTLFVVAQKHPEMTLVDWNAASRDHPEWFQNDGVHLLYDGAVGLATTVHDAISEALIPPPTVRSTRLPTARVGKRYAVRLPVAGGIAPVKWSIASGTLPKGLRLRADGQIWGTPKVPGRGRFVIRVTDARGRESVQPEMLIVSGPLRVKKPRA
jgi:hypothetical protein